MKHFDVIIVGAGHGGANAAIALRKLGFAGTIALVGREPELPYERPPLSKEYLAGDKPFERLLIRPAAFWEERAVTLLLGSEVTSIDPDGHTVEVAGLGSFGYGSLIWAAGGEARRLTCAGADLERVHTVRSREDVDRMRRELEETSQIVVVGGGYIGLEAAAVLVKLGKKVCLVEALDRLLARVAGETIAGFFADEHRAHGVDIRLGSSVAALEGSEGRVRGVRLADGEFIPAEMVVVGIGLVPSVGPLLAAGASGGNGVDVDENCKTSLPDVYAIGDCAAHSNLYAAGARVRLESVQNANDQAMTAARAITGEPQPYQALPWFWSNQFDLKLQTAGLSLGHDSTMVKGDPATRSFSVEYLRDGVVVSVDCVNAVKDYVQARRLIESSRSA